MHTATVPTKGQVVIPAPLRRKLGFEQGTKVDDGLAYADCFAAALALVGDGEVIPGDPAFAAVEQVAVRWLGQE